VAVKSERQLEVYCAAREAPYAYVTSYPILGASGHLGPKLRFGDFQVPEGMYELTLEPNTPYHLALRLNYPNDADLARAQSDGRNPGSDILIHGTTGSIGCLAMGDPASEDLFVLVHDARVKKVPLIIAPVDLRQQAAPQQKPTDPVWLPDLYRDIKQAMSIFRKPVDDSSSTNSRR
jgi:murein L,D-transpeptidase YafK